MAENKDSSARDGILVVDDQPLVLELLTRMVEAGGANVFSATNGEDALELFRAHCGEIGLIISDATMKGMDGLALIQAAREIAPDIATMVISGSLSETQRQGCKDLGIGATLQKPFSLSDLTTAIELARSR